MPREPAVTKLSVGGAIEGAFFALGADAMGAGSMAMDSMDSSRVMDDWAASVTRCESGWRQA
eukprot:scaffold92551_cov32-Tisochrysis_lutea.AAC.3